MFADMQANVLRTFWALHAYLVEHVARARLESVVGAVGIPHSVGGLAHLEAHTLRSPHWQAHPTSLSNHWRAHLTSIGT